MLGVDNKVVAEWIRDNLDFDQLILEFYKDGEPTSGWIHFSYSNKRGSVLAMMAKTKRIMGLVVL